MTLDIVEGIRRLRELINEIDDIPEVYAASEDDEHGIPDTIQNPPAVLIFPGDTIEYIANNSWESHKYNVTVQVLQSGADVASRTASVLPLVNEIIKRCRMNVTMGGRVAYCVFRGSSGLVKLEYGDEEYEGYEITLEIKESGAVTDLAVGE